MQTEFSSPPDGAVIRDVQAKDIPAIKGVIGEVWDWAELAEDEKIFDATVGMYLNQVLYESAFGRVAVLNDKVVGVIFGSVNAAEPKYRMLMEDGTAHTLTLLGAPEDVRQIVHEYFAKLSTVYEQLVSGILDSYDGTLDFLVLSKDAQGLGIGKDLWMALKSYFEDNGAKSVYLYSDTDCNFGFYERQGFTKRREREITFVFDDEAETVSQFLYEYHFDKQ